MEITVAVLAGGQSSRMGTDKARLEVEGTSLLERTAALALSAGFSVRVVGRVRPADWTLDAVDFAEDAVPGRGPLGGLETALRLACGPLLALACDMPRLAPSALLWLSAQAAEPGPADSQTHGLTVRNNGRWEPLFSVYTPACLPLIAARLAGEDHSLRGLIAAGKFAGADAPDWVVEQLVNVNTPDDVARLWKSSPPRSFSANGEPPYS